MAWLKLPDEVLRDLQIREFTNDEIIIWLTMLCLASRETRQHRGMLLVNRRAAQPREIAAEARVDVAVVEAAIAKALHWNMLVDAPIPGTEDLALEIADWDRIQIDRTAAARKRKERAVSTDSTCEGTPAD